MQKLAIEIMKTSKYVELYTDICKSNEYMLKNVQKYGFIC